MTDSKESVAGAVLAARTRMQSLISQAAARSRLLQPGCRGRYGNRYPGEHGRTAAIGSRR